MQVELEIRVDGGGGEPGEAVVQLSQNWNWTHGVKVAMINDDEGEAGQEVVTTGFMD